MRSEPGAASATTPATTVGELPGEPFDPVGIEWSRVSAKLATARRISALITLVLPALAVVVLALTVSPMWWVVLVVPVGVAVWCWWLIGRQVRAIGYAEREDDLLVRRGIMWRYVVVVPYGRLQYVDVQAGPIDRLFGIARVQLHTASAATDAQIPGLVPAEAARVRDRLSARGQAGLAGL